MLREFSQLCVGIGTYRPRKVLEATVEALIMSPLGKLLSRSIHIH